MKEAQALFDNTNNIIMQNVDMTYINSALETGLGGDHKKGCSSTISRSPAKRYSNNEVRVKPKQRSVKNHASS